MKNNYVKIITGEESFQERVDELGSSVSYEEVKHCVSQLKRALYNNPEVPALCAPQIGKSLRLFVVRTAKEETERFKIFLNPLIVSSEGMHLSREMNPSFPGNQYIIPRKNKVHVAFQKEDGQVDSETFFGAYGEVVQQMIEMLDGITLNDYGLNLNDVGGPEVFDKASNKQKTDLLALYLQNLKLDSKSLEEEINKDPELKNLNDTIKFMTGMLTGDIKPINPVKVDNKEKE